jgi:tetratricopeptide (TPR) repeat protein
MRSLDVSVKSLALSIAVLGGVASVAQGQSPQQLFEAGQNDQAMVALTQQREAGEVGPTQAYLAGQILLKANQDAGARGEFDSLVALADTPWKLIGESAVAALDGDNGRAVAAATQASEMAPDLFEAQYQLGLVKARVGDWSGSAAALDRASQINPSFAYAHYNAGQAYSKVKRIDLTAEHFERFLRLAPAAPERAGVESLMRTLRGR